MKCSGQCKQDKPVDAFGWRNKAAGKRNTRCLVCQRIYSRQHYRANKPYYRARNKLRRDRVDAWLRELKEATPCADCGQKFAYYVMDFDHRPGEIKVDGVARMHRGYDQTQIQAEIDKCDVVCANCHRIRTHKRL
jgi:hypothetical protein